MGLLGDPPSTAAEKAQSTPAPSKSAKDSLNLDPSDIRIDSSVKLRAASVLGVGETPGCQTRPRSRRSPLSRGGASLRFPGREYYPPDCVSAFGQSMRAEVGSPNPHLRPVDPMVAGSSLAALATGKSRVFGLTAESTKTPGAAAPRVLRFPPVSQRFTSLAALSVSRRSFGVPNEKRGSHIRDPIEKSRNLRFSDSTPPPSQEVVNSRE